jgi:hypothetical protein
VWARSSRRDRFPQPGGELAPRCARERVRLLVVGRIEHLDRDVRAEFDKRFPGLLALVINEPSD